MPKNRRLTANFIDDLVKTFAQYQLKEINVKSNFRKDGLRQEYF